MGINFYKTIDDQDLNAMVDHLMPSRISENNFSGRGGFKFSLFSLDLYSKLQLDDSELIAGKRMREIVDDVLTWPWLSEVHGYNFNGHLIRLPEGNVCVDPALLDDDLLEEIADEGVARVVITNRNHSRAAVRVRARTGAHTAAHPDDAPHIIAEGTEVDETISAGDRIGPLEVVSAAGKSPGEIALYWRARGILIVGDSVIGHPAGECGLLPEAKIDDPARLRDSLRRFLDLDFDTLLVGDGASILTGAKDRLRRLIDSFPN